MQVDASVMAREIEPLRAIAAIAIAPPMMAKINAYSAAEAPDSSFNILMNVFIRSSFKRSCPFAGDKLPLRIHGRTMKAKPPQPAAQ